MDDSMDMAMRNECCFRFRDIVLSLVLLFFLLPVMALLALIIWLDSPGASPIFSQQRVGLEGSTFRMYKFRTMVPGAEAQLSGLLSYNEMDGPAFKLREDPRITRLGRFLRCSGLDELPQLWNILLGDMSFVGPRPALPRETAQYTAYQKQRLAVKPGLTCYWQIQPHRNRLSFQQWMELDLKYIRERSLLLDGKILLATLGAVLGMNGE